MERNAFGLRMWKVVSLLLCIALLVPALPFTTAARAAAPLDSSSAPAAQAAQQNTCDLYPIALHGQVLAGKALGDTVAILNGVGPGNFGWLTWTGDQSAEALARSLTPPGNSHTYTNPADPSDHALSVGDYGRGRLGDANSDAVRAALEALKAIDITVPVWDQVKGSGANTTYRVDLFARLRIVDDQSSAPQRIGARFLGFVGCGSEPQTEPVSATTDEDTSVTLTLRATHLHPSPLTFQIGSVAHGTLGAPSAHECSTSGALTSCTVTVAYTPDENFHGSDAFSFRVSDGRLDSAPASATLTIAPINDQPTAIADAATTAEDVAAVIDVLSNDTDVDGDALTVSAVKAPAHGTAALIDGGPDAGKLRYTPAPNYNGPDSLSYTIADGQGGSAVTMVALLVEPVNDAPQLSAQPASLAVDEDAPAQTITLSGADIETAAAELQLKLTTLPQHGALTRTDGTHITLSDTLTNPIAVVYTPAADEHGVDALGVAIVDGGDGVSLPLTSALTVAVTINMVNDAPSANNRKLEDVRRGAVASIELGGADVDSAALSFEIVTPPSHGALGPVGDIHCTAVDSGASCTAVLAYTAGADFAGTDSFTYTTNDGSLDSAPATVSIVVTNAAPVASAQSVAANEDTTSAITLQASDHDGDALAYTIVTAPSHGEVVLNGNTSMYTPAPNYHGPDSFSFSVSDGLAESQVASVTIMVAPVNDAPAFTAAPTNNAQTIDEGQGLTALAATDIDGDTLAFSLVQGFLPSGVTLATDGSFQGVAVTGSAGSYSVEIAVADNNGGTTTTTLDITVNAPSLPLPPDPSTLAPPLDQQAATSMVDATKFLYTGSNPIQKDVTAGAIDPQRAGVLRGNVASRDELPIAGVRISVKDHPEYGYTLTRRDGMFDLAVNGGGLLTLDYEKSGYLPVQRQIDVPWQDYAALPDVVMIALDSAVTPIDLAAASSIQVAQGSPVTDVDGTRQATLLFPQGTAAEMTLPDGSKQPLTTLHVRATEYTVGEHGLESMPGELPTNSGYTYAIELSVDEALQAGAKEVHFDQALPFYVENFLGFPVGTVVPVGYYDREQAQWVGSQNGRVIKILSEADGKALLDIDGSGTPASAAALAALGMSDAERQQLVALYEPGQGLWRTPITHFTPWDCNWPYGPPEDSLKPNQQALNGEQEQPEDNAEQDDDERRCGSVVGCVNQTLGEAVDIAGVPFKLYYQSDRTYGYAAGRMLDIPLSGATIPGSVTAIKLEITVAGRLFRKSFAKAPNQRYTFIWDGKDAYGRLVQGQHRVKVRVGYEYPIQYYATADQARKAWARVDGAPLSMNGPSRRAEAVMVWQEWESRIGGWTTRSIGPQGWDFSIHHAYDPGGRTLLLGNGLQRSANGADAIVMTTIAGDPFAVRLGDGGPAINASIKPRDVEVGPDGSVYIADMSNHRVRKVAPNRTITTVAGIGVAGFAGDGGPATAARLSFPTGIALGPDGSLYIADSLNSRIRKVGLDGIITTVAGNGTLGAGGDEGPATAAQLGRAEDVAVANDGTIYIADTQTNLIRQVNPDGNIITIAGGGSKLGDGGPARLAQLHGPRGLAIGPDGSLYIADMSNDRVRRITPDGIITTVAGNGLTGFSGDGGLAKDAQLSGPKDVAVDSSGNIYIASNQRVRMVENGIIRTVAGSGQVCGQAFDCVDGASATSSKLTDAYGLAVAPDGSFYVADSSTWRVRRVQILLPGATSGELLVPSEDGGEAYRFRADGQHLQTIDTLTGAIRYAFAYDSAGRLQSITDVNGRVTRVERNAQGTPTAVVAPNGQRTMLALSGAGDLERIVNPANETHTMGYAANSLLASFTIPRGGTSSFSYDSLGRLLADKGPDGSAIMLSRSQTASGFKVVVMSALGRTTTHEIERLKTGDQRMTTTRPDGTKTVELTRTDGSRQTIAADGTVTDLVFGPDPRWGMLAPLVKQITRHSPGGLQSVATSSRTAQLSNAVNPLSLVSASETVTVNGHALTTSYDAALRQATTTSAAGRKTTVKADARGRVVQVQAPGVLALDYSYDERGRLSQVAQGTRAWSYSYDTLDHMTKLTDPLGRSVSFEYDAAGRITKRTQPDGASIVSSYDANGDLSSIVPAGRGAHAFDRSAGRLVEAYTPPAVGTDPSTTSYAYNRDKQPTLIARPDGATLGFEYDAAGRIQALLLGAQSVSYDYNASTGNLSTVTAADGGTLSYTYDGSLPRSATWAGSAVGSVGWTYTSDLQLQAISFNGANAISYGYDADGLLTSAGALTLSRNVLTGQLQNLTVGGVGTNIGYDDFGHIKTNSASYGATTLLATEFVRNALDRITRKTETVDGQTVTYEYTYDLAGQLTNVARDGTSIAHYAYDANGNRTGVADAAGTRAATYDAQDRLTQLGDTSYAYTANGELLSKRVGGQTTSYQYDLLGNLRAVTQPDGTQISYLVDGQNQRIGKLINGTRVQGFLYEGQLRPIAELDGSGAVVSRFVYATQPSVPEYMIKGGTTYRIITDERGSVRLVVNTATGGVVQRMDYDVWGKVTHDSNPGFQPFGFAGGLYDRDTGLVRFGARDYDADSGRWTAKDPILFAGGQANLYVYAGNDPVNFIDPTGLAGEEVECGEADPSSETEPGRSIDWGFLGDSFGVLLGGGTLAAIAQVDFIVGRILAQPSAHSIELYFSARLMLEEITSEAVLGASFGTVVAGVAVAAAAGLAIGTAIDHGYTAVTGGSTIGSDLYDYIYGPPGSASAGGR